LSDWCKARFGFQHQIESEPAPRPLDLPWIVIDSGLAQQTWNWSPSISLREIFEEVAKHAEQHPDWLGLSAPF
jgi:CDP-paratose 2-epimerase